MDHLKHLALRLKVHNVSGSIVHHVALLIKTLEHKGIKASMVKGYCVIEQTNEACEHYWAREDVSGLDLDIGFAVACLRCPELTALHPVLLETLPPGLTRSDLEETMILEGNSRLFQQYRTCPKDFWRESPRDVATYQVK
jgi:hypothetical protein